MRDQSQNGSTALSTETQVTLTVLDSVHSNHAVTQRHIAEEAGIALGLVNAYLKRCIKKGYIKVKQAPANRYAYYLTPIGFAEKSRLTAFYLSQSFNLFRVARNDFEPLFDTCEQSGWLNVALFGASDLSEIATLCGHNNSVTIMGVISPLAQEEAIAGLPVYASPDDLPGLDAIILCDLASPQATYEHLVSIFPKERVLAPALLRISDRPAADDMMGDD